LEQCGCYNSKEGEETAKIQSTRKENPQFEAREKQEQESGHHSLRINNAGE
jgi:hypothetical protein